MKDLFECIETLPKEVQSIIEGYNNEENDYTECEVLKYDLNQVGYTCDYGLDGIPFNLTPKYHKLNSVGCVLDVDTLRVYPMYNDGSFDVVGDSHNGVLLNECFEEWVENLSIEDKFTVTYWLNYNN